MTLLASPNYKNKAIAFSVFASYDVAMSPLIVLALIAGVPLLLASVFRIKPLYFFVSIVTGYFWAQFLGETAELTLRSTIHISNPDVVMRVGLLLIPVVLTFAFLRKTLSTSALPFLFFLLVADSLLLTTFLLPLLTPGMQNAIYQTQAGSVVRQAHDVAIAGVAGLHLVVMLIMRSKLPHGKGRHRK